MNEQEAKCDRIEKLRMIDAAQIQIDSEVRDLRWLVFKGVAETIVRLFILITLLCLADAEWGWFS